MVRRHRAHPPAGGGRELGPRARPLSEAVSAYDAPYVALAQRDGVALATADARLARGAAGLCEVLLVV